MSSCVHQICLRGLQKSSQLLQSAKAAIEHHEQTLKSMQTRMAALDSSKVLFLDVAGKGQIAVSMSDIASAHVLRLP